MLKNTGWMRLGKEYPFVRKSLDFEPMDGEVAATFCAEPKNEEIDEGTPKELWHNASQRIESFVDKVEKMNIPYVILSYKYGIVGSNEVIDNYNIGKAEVDMDEWAEMVSTRADELDIEKMHVHGNLARASVDISNALDKTDPEIEWIDTFDDLANEFYPQKTIEDEAENEEEDDENE